MITTRTIARATASAVVGAAIGVSLITAAGTASASAGQDAEFISGLRSQGITTSNPARTAQMGQLACMKLESGTSLNNVVDQIGRIETGLDADHVARFVGASVSAYCPQIAASVVAHAG
jgi:hypothetical protein